jgi:phenylpyruvate tautomerase PptA (4-oxalocrotonate tautomerase family)
MSQLSLQDVQRRSMRAAAVSGVGAAIIVGALVFAVVAVDSAERTLTDLHAKQAKLASDITAAEAQLVQKKAELASLSQVTAASLGYKQAVPPTTTTLIESVKANNLVQTQAGADTNSRRAITVTIYSKLLDREVNQNVVLPKLRNLGFTVRIAPGRGAIAYVPTNAVWFGSAVRIEDVKLLALSLISAGVKIRVIKPFADANGAKRNAIDIGADAQFARNRPLALEDVANAQSFSR